MAHKVIIYQINGVDYSLTVADPPDPADFPKWSQSFANEIREVLLQTPTISPIADVAQNKADIALLMAEPQVESGQWGQTNLTINAGATHGPVTVTFTKAFSGAPNVVTDLGSAPSTAFNLVSHAINITANGFSLYITNHGTKTFTSSAKLLVDWVAVGPR